jgi:hypothetical protein
MNVMIQVAPFYFTWIILALIFLKDDRKKAKLALFLSCIGLGYLEGFIVNNYGRDEYE